MIIITILYQLSWLQILTSVHREMAVVSTSVPTLAAPSPAPAGVVTFSAVTVERAKVRFHSIVPAPSHCTMSVSGFN